VTKNYGISLVQETFFFLSRRTYRASCEFLIVVTADFTSFWDLTLFETGYRQKACGQKIVTNTCTDELNTKKFGNQ